MDSYVIIVAGGSGTRMGTDIPKQFLLLNGQPVIMCAVRAFRRCQYSPQIVVVLPENLHSYWSALCSEYGFDVPHWVAGGGASRFQSVKNGLLAIRERKPDLSDTLIAVHDAARPLVSPDIIDATFAESARTGTAALAIPSSDSVRIESSNTLKNNGFPRHRVYLMQTPQTFQGSILWTSYQQEEDPAFTDDASVVEKKGYPISLVTGDTRNIKITFPEDLRIAAILSDAGLRSTPDDAQQNSNNGDYQQNVNDPARVIPTKIADRPDNN